MPVLFHILWFIYFFLKKKSLLKNCKKFKHKKKTYECDQTPVQISYTGCRVSILGHVQNPTGCGPEQPAVVGLALSRGIGLETSRF